MAIIPGICAPFPLEVPDEDTGATTLAALTDVDLTDLEDGQVLAWDAGAEKFVPLTLAP